MNAHVHLKVTGLSEGFETARALVRAFAFVDSHVNLSSKESVFKICCVSSTLSLHSVNFIRENETAFGLSPFGD